MASNGHKNTSAMNSAHARKQVDWGLQLPCSGVTVVLGLVDFEELYATELETTLNEVPDDGGPKPVARALTSSATTA